MLMRLQKVALSGGEFWPRLTVGRDGPPFMDQKSEDPGDGLVIALGIAAGAGQGVQSRGDLSSA